LPAYGAEELAFYFVALKQLGVLAGETSANKGYLSAHIFVNCISR